MICMGEYIETCPSCDSENISCREANELYEEYDCLDCDYFFRVYYDGTLED